MSDRHSSRPQDNSFDALQDSETIWLTFQPRKATFVELVDPSIFEHGIEPIIIYQANLLLDKEDKGAIFELISSIRIELRVRNEDKILALDGKFPLGWIEIQEWGTTAVLFVRTALGNIAAQQMAVLESVGLRIGISIPRMDKYPYGVYPILVYNYQAHTSANGA